MIRFKIVSRRPLSPKEMQEAKHHFMEQHRKRVHDYQEDFKQRTGLDIEFEHAERMVVGIMANTEIIRAKVSAQTLVLQNPWAFHNKFLGTEQ